MMLAAGSRVRTKPKRRDGHTRLPEYLQCKRGVVVAALGAFVFPDENVDDPERARQSQLYTIAFPASSIFEERSDDGVICADLFEEYLEVDE